jgi:hypothetical protein
MMFAAENGFGKAHKVFEELLEVVNRASDEKARIDQLEREVFSVLLKLGFEILSQFVAQAGDGDEGETIETNGQRLQRFSEKKRRPYRSIFGVLEVTRWVYGMREGQKAIYIPLDARLGMPAGEQSYVLEDWLQRFCVQDAFSSGVSSLQELLGIKTSVRTAERMNRELGKLADDYRAQQPATNEAEAEILVVTADAKGVPMRTTLEEQLGKDIPAWRRHDRKVQAQKAGERAQKRLGRGQVRTHKQMAYVGAVYSIERWIRTADDVLNELLRRDQKSQRPKPRNKQVRAEMTYYRDDERIDGQPLLFASLAMQCYHRDPNKEKLLVCLMDGQRSLWGLKDSWLKRAVGILDIFHAMEWLWKAAYCFYSEGSRQAEEFVTKYLRMFLEGKVVNTIRSLRRKRARLRPAKQQSLDSVIRYFTNNQQYMKYDEYLRAGYPIGSGVVEGACRHLVRDRMERSGMRWDIHGAQAMLDTRAIFINGQWDDFITYRIEAEQSRVYRQAA